MCPKNITEALYRSVFLLDKEDKLGDVSTYPIFVTHPDFLFKEDIFQKLSVYLQNKYVNVSISTEVEHTELIKEANFICSQMDVCGIYQKYLTYRYCIFAYYDGKDKNVFDWVKKTFDVLKYLLDIQHRSGKDCISLFLCFSNDINTNELVDNISSLPVERVKLYLLSYNPILETRKTLYIDSVCGAVISCCDPQNDAINRQKRTETESRVRNYVYENEALEKAKRCEWHTIVCNSYDKENEFIRSYISRLIACATKLDDDSVKTILSDVYGSSRLNCGASLQTAFDHIPRIVKNDMPNLKGAVSNLSQYFKYLFGEDGTKNVDLTLKATLANYSKGRIATDIQGAAINIYKRCCEYGIKDLDKTVGNLIGNKTETLKADFKQKRGSVDKVLNMLYDSEEVDQIIGTVSEYIKLYEELAEIENEINFWNNVLAKISSNHSAVEEFCVKSSFIASFCEEIENFVNTEPFKFNFDFKNLPVIKMTPGNLVSLLKSVLEGSKSADCFVQAIKNAYDTLGDVSVAAVVQSYVSDVFCLEPLPMIYSSFDNVQINCECASFMGKEYVGLYLIFNSMGRGAIA